MKEKIHPNYIECKVICGCGNTFVTRSTKPELHVEICSSCHPYYTGKQKLIDTAGRVEKFQKRHAWDNSTMGKVLEKEAPKKAPKKLEKVTVGLPRQKKRKPGEDADLDIDAGFPGGPRGRGGPGGGGRGGPGGGGRGPGGPGGAAAGGAGSAGAPRGAPKEPAAKGAAAKAPEGPKPEPAPAGEPK